MSNWAETRMHTALEGRRKRGTYRRLHFAENDHQTITSIDFSSNDYLGLAHDKDQQQKVAREFHKISTTNLGATGSRLLSGDAPSFHQLESYLAVAHNRAATLLCNSGYDANLTIISCLPCDVLLFDEYVHNSIHMGMRLWQSVDAERRTIANFHHNDAADMRRRLRDIHHQDPNLRVIVIVESVYSMDGDVAPVKDMLAVAESSGARMVVDEAHGFGVYGDASRKRGGMGVLASQQVENHPALLCSVCTYGKAAGCHGAVLCFPSQLHKDYVVNYGYPFIYSTALPIHSLITIKCCYETVNSRKGDLLRQRVFDNVKRFRERMREILPENHSIHLLPSNTPIQALIIADNNKCSQFCRILQNASNRRINLYPIKSPTVPIGLERVRIILHSNNTVDEIDLLVSLIRSTLEEMNLIQRKSKL